VKLISLFVCFIMVAIVVPALNCGKDDKAPTEQDGAMPQELLGRWVYQSATVNDIPISLAFILGWNDETVSARFSVSEDESFLYEELDSSDAVIWTANGTFIVQGDSATITITNNDDGPVDPPNIMSGTWAVEGNQLTLTTTYNSLQVILIATKDN